MPYRNPVITRNTTSEKGTATAINLGGSAVTTQGLVPKASNNQSIVGMLVTMDMTVQQSVATPFTAGDIFGGMTIKKGANTRVNISSYAQLVRVYNALTRLNDSNAQYFNNEAVTGAAGTVNAKLEFFLPIELTTDIIPVAEFEFNALSTISATSGTVTTTITYYYSTQPVRDDLISIVTAPSTLNANTEIDISQYFTFTGVVDEVWFDVGTDATLDYQRFRIGKTVIFDNYTAWELRASTVPHVFNEKVDGLYQAKAIQTAYPPNGVSSAKPILEVSLTNAVAPTFYLFSKI